MPRSVETLAELAADLSRSGAPRARLALLGRIARAVDPAVAATVGQIPARDRDWVDIALLLGGADPQAAECLYGPEAGRL
jgi:hypothetical protein